MFRSLCLSALALFGAVSAQAPIPNKPDGYPLGGAPSAPVVFEAFYDLMCPDSRQTWPVIQSVVSHYGDNMHFRLHTFPLPYHTWSFVANQGAHVLDKNVTAVYAWMDAVFANQEAFGNDNTAGMTRTQVEQAFADLAQKSNIMSSSIMLQGLQDPNQDWNTRVSWKYGCSRAITGTPQFLINGVYISASLTWALTDWQSIIDPLLAPSITTRAGRQGCKASAEENPFTIILESTCPAGQCSADKPCCEYLPQKYECCLPGENCIKNVGCRC